MSNSHSSPHQPENIARVQVIAYQLRLRRSWRFARGIYRLRYGWLVRLESNEGVCGYGDCAPVPEMGTENLSVAERQLRRGANACIGFTPHIALLKLDNWNNAPAARCALETALVDLIARRVGLPVARWLSHHPTDSVKLNAMLGELDDSVEARAKQAIEEGFTVLKIKLGVKPVAEEKIRLINLVALIPAGVKLRLDVNGGWNETELQQMLPVLCELPVESLEEPLANPKPNSLRHFQAMVPWPLALDESLPTCKHKLFNLLENPPVQRIVLKPMLLGGMIPALKLARRSQRVGLESVVTTTVDSAVGVWAALQLAAALDNPNAVHGLNTGSWLIDDIGDGPIQHEGCMQLSDEPGLGFRMQT